MDNVQVLSIVHVIVIPKNGGVKMSNPNIILTGVCEKCGKSLDVYVNVERVGHENVLKLLDAQPHRCRDKNGKVIL
jgi:hypothetical protein